MNPLILPDQPLRYRALIGTGGVGTGMFFAIKGNRTLGREESREGRFLDQRDYCKLHIIAHYVKVLLGPVFPAILISKVGQDDTGHRLLKEMAGTGLDICHVAIDPDKQTMNAVCFLYPDGSGGNLTVNDSACANVDEHSIHAVADDFARYAHQGIALAAPEVPLNARRELLSLATEHGFFRAASFSSGEIPQSLHMGLFAMLDLVAINMDEATALLGRADPDEDYSSIAADAVACLMAINPALRVSVTGGRQGSWTWDGHHLQHAPALAVKTVSSAGAGDAHFAALLAGLAANLTLPQAQELATLTAACSVTSPHTIHPTLDRTLLAVLAVESGIPLSDPVRHLLGIERKGI